MEAEKPKAWVEMIIQGEELRAALTTTPFDNSDGWIEAAVAADKQREKLAEKLIGPAWATLLSAMPHHKDMDMGTPEIYKVTISVEPHGS